MLSLAGEFFVSLTSRSIGLLLLNRRITIPCSLVVVVPTSPAREETLQHCLPLVVGNRLVHISCWSVNTQHILLFLFVSFDLFVCLWPRSNVSEDVFLLHSRLSAAFLLV